MRINKQLQHGCTDLEVVVSDTEAWDSQQFVISGWSELVVSVASLWHFALLPERQFIPPFHLDTFGSQRCSRPGWVQEVVLLLMVTHRAKLRRRVLSQWTTLLVLVAVLLIGFRHRTSKGDHGRLHVVTAQQLANGSATQDGEFLKLIAPCNHTAPACR